jgi:hypothetical protein
MLNTVKKISKITQNIIFCNKFAILPLQFLPCEELKLAEVGSGKLIADRLKISANRAVFCQPLLL